MNQLVAATWPQNLLLLLLLLRGLIKEGLSTITYKCKSGKWKWKSNMEIEKCTGRYDLLLGSVAVGIIAVAMEVHGDVEKSFESP